MSLNDDAKNAVMTYNNKKAVEVAKKAIAEDAEIAARLEAAIREKMPEAAVPSAKRSRRR